MQGDQNLNLPLALNRERCFILDTSVVVDLLKGSLRPSIVNWIGWQNAQGCICMTDQVSKELLHLNYRLEDVQCQGHLIPVKYLTQQEAQASVQMKNELLCLAPSTVYGMHLLDPQDVLIYCESAVLANRLPQVVSVVTGDLKWHKKWTLASQIISPFLQSNGLLCLPLVATDQLVKRVLYDAR